MVTKPKGFRLAAATGTHKGDRDYQQDQVAIFPNPRFPGSVLAVCADGMGGKSGGRKAADQVIMTAKQLFDRFSPVGDDPKSFLLQIVNESHITIKLTAISSEMEPHSTITAFLISPEGDCHWVHAGDSRIYHFRGDRLLQRTKDHSYVQTLVDKGEITDEEANVHPKSNILMGCLGGIDEPPQSFTDAGPLQPGDTVIACTDGLWHYFTNEELGAVLSRLSPREASEFLVAKARQRANGGGDNLSLAVIKVEPLA
jgi:serine/threonine protein phosphatase PrpC